MASERDKELAWLRRRIDELGADASRFQESSRKLGLPEVADHLGRAISAIEMAEHFLPDVIIDRPTKDAP